MDRETILVSPVEAAIMIRLGDLPTYECGAILFAHLAFPGPEAEDERARCHAALCHLAIQAIANEDEGVRWRPTMIKPAYALLNEGEVRRAVRTFDRSMKMRSAAAVVAKPFLEESSTGQPPRLPACIDRLSITSMAEYLMYRGGRDPGVGDVKNFHARVWMPSLPVIHLAVALNLLFERRLSAGIAGFGAYDLIRSPEAVEFLVETARPLEEAFQVIPKLNMPQNSLWKFRLG